MKSIKFILMGIGLLIPGLFYMVYGEDIFYKIVGFLVMAAGSPIFLIGLAKIKNKSA